MRMCSDDEAAALPVGNNQLCAIGTDSSAYQVCMLQQALQNSCELLRHRKELHTSSCNCMQAHETSCTFMELHASS